MTIYTPAVARRLILSGDAPESMTVGGWLDLSDCTGLTSLPEGLAQHGKPGRVLSFDGNYILTRTDAGEFIAGCRYFPDAAAALKHWEKRNDDRAIMFTKAIKECAA